MVNILISKDKIALVDDIDSDLLQFKWYASKSGKNCILIYAVRSIYIDVHTTKHVKMHRTIMERKLGRTLLKDELIDHINHDGLDNRRKNLRLASHLDNVRYHRKGECATSKYIGVYWSKDHNRWVSRIHVNKKIIHLGYFRNEDDAAIAYNEAADKYFKKFANLNDVDCYGKI